MMRGTEVVVMICTFHNINMSESTNKSCEKVSSHN